MPRSRGTDSSDPQFRMGEGEELLSSPRVVPEDAAQRIKAESEGYRAATIAKAEGDAQRFTLLVAQYRKAPEVTRKRLYLETMQQVLAGSRKVVSGRDNNVLYLADGQAGGVSRGVHA